MDVVNIQLDNDGTLNSSLIYRWKPGKKNMNFVILHPYTYVAIRACRMESLCSTLVRNTVVRAIVQAYGKWWISTPWGAETAEPIEMKLGVGDYVGDPTSHAQNEKCT